MPEYWTLVRNTTNKDLELTRIHSLASEKWKKETTEKLIEFCKILSSFPEGNRVAGIHLCDGVSHEWHYWGFIEHEPDNGIAMTKYFRYWLKEKYKTVDTLRAKWNNPDVTFDNATVPGMKERKYTSDGLFRDPRYEQYVIDYYDCQHQVVANDIIHFCKTVKENWPRPILTGVFYGYFFMMFSRQTVGGHLEMEKILSSKYIDYLSAPHAYWWESKLPDGSGQSRAILGSLLLHGKFSLEENDASTTFGSLQEKYWNTPKQKADSLINFDILKIRRSVFRPYCEGVGSWFFDFGPDNHSGWWDMPVYMAEIKKSKQILDSLVTLPKRKDIADVLVVYDDKSYLHIRPGWNSISEMCIDHFSSELYKTGAIFNSIYLFDLPKVNLDQYKAVIFANAWFISDSMRKFIIEKVAKNGRHILWNYLPGYSNGKELNLGFVDQLTGLSLKRINFEGRPDLIITDVSCWKFFP